MTNPQNTRRDEILAAMPSASPGIVTTTGAHRNVVNRWTTRLHAAGEIHIVDWIRWKGGPLPVYAAGPGVDVPCTLEKLPQRERTARFVTAARADGRWQKKLERDRARAEKRRQVWANGYMRDPLLGHFFGKPKRPHV